MKINPPFLPLFATFDHLCCFSTHELLLGFEKRGGYKQGRATIKLPYTVLKALKPLVRACSAAILL